MATGMEILCAIAGKVPVFGMLTEEGRKAYVRETNAVYYTEAIDYTRLKVLESFEDDGSKELPPLVLPAVVAAVNGVDPDIAEPG